MSESPQTEALAAIAHAIDVLGDSKPIEGLRRYQLRASLEYAHGQVTLIQAVKRARRAAEAPPEAP